MASGDVTPQGLILDGSAQALLTETFTPTQQRFQGHHGEKNPITPEDQVQIYEALAVNPEGFLTTSFMAFDHKVKDNRAAAGLELQEPVCGRDWFSGDLRDIHSLRSRISEWQRIERSALSGSFKRLQERGLRERGHNRSRNLVLPDDSSLLP